MKEYEQKIYNIIGNAREEVIFQTNQAYKNGYMDGYVDGKDGQKEKLANAMIYDHEVAEKKAYNRGLADMLEAVKSMRMMTADDLKEVFGVLSIGDIFVNLPPSEIASKYHAFKDQINKQKQDDWRDIPSDEMTLEQARRAVKELRAEVLKEMRGDENDE